MSSPFMKTYEKLHVELTETFFTLQLYWPTPCMTLGGLKTDPKTGKVVSKDGQTIPGLYAAGRNAAGVAAGGYISGLSLADCVQSGRVAGRAAAVTAAASGAASRSKL